MDSPDCMARDFGFGNEAGWGCAAPTERVRRAKHDGASVCERAALLLELAILDSGSRTPDMDRMGKLGVALALLRCAARCHRRSHRCQIFEGNIHVTYVAHVTLRHTPACRHLRRHHHHLTNPNRFLQLRLTPSPPPRSQDGDGCEYKIRESALERSSFQGTQTGRGVIAVSVGWPPWATPGPSRVA